MYSYITGEMVAISEDEIVVDNHGIGYRFFVSRFTQANFMQVGKQVKVYTYLHVREDAMQLFGFATQEELEFFKKLITVSGIGAKGAMSILSQLSVADLRLAILTEDVKAIAASHGIGQKTAQRVVLDLKDKIDGIAVAGNADQQALSANQVLKSDVIEAMKSLGYSPSQALGAYEQVALDMEITEDTTVEVVLKEVLKKMAFI